MTARAVRDARCWLGASRFFVPSAARRTGRWSCGLVRALGRTEGTPRELWGSAGDAERTGMRTRARTHLVGSGGGRGGLDFLLGHGVELLGVVVEG